MNVVVLGAPGSGKGTQAARIAAKGGLKHVSSGDLLRAAVENKTEIGQQVASIMAKGHLVPDEKVLALVTEALSQEDARSGWILDGYPRTADQAEALEDVISTNRETVDFVLVLDVDDETVVERTAGRGRDDDGPDIVRKRLRVFSEEMAPVLEFYELRYDIHNVDGSRSVDEVTESVYGVLGL